jgi:hypothetical protein
MKTHSLVRRATVTVLGIELLCAVGFASFAVWHERETRLHALDATLGGRSDSLVGAVQDAEDPADNVKVDPDEFSPPSIDEYAVYNPDVNAFTIFVPALIPIACCKRAPCESSIATRPAEWGCGAP